MSREEEFIAERAKRKTPKRLTRVTTPLAKRGGKGNAYQHTRTGYRDDIGVVTRSGWEANCLRILKSFDIAFEYEPAVFTFPIQRGVKGYIPDIYLTDTLEFIEIKGYLDSKGKTKLKRFKKYYPESFAQLIIICGNDKKNIEFFETLGVKLILSYNELKRIFKPLIKNWEGQ